MQPLNRRTLIAMTLSLPALGMPGAAPGPHPIVIGHRGASALRPEHTLAAYQQAIDDGADFIEPDLVITADGVLVARHENEIGTTTDVARRPEFAARRTTKTIDGTPLNGWFTEDFTLAELKTLRAIERIPQNRPGNVTFNGQFEVPTFEEVMALAQRASRETGRTVGIYPETKHPSYFQHIGQPLEPPLLAALAQHGYTGPNAPVFVQSFEVSNLRALRSQTQVPLIQLLGGPSQQPYDAVLAKRPLTYGEMASAAGLREVAGYAPGRGSGERHGVIPRDAANRLAHPHQARGQRPCQRPEGAHLHPETRKTRFCQPTCGVVTWRRPGARGDMAAEVRAYLEAGVDGFFTDDPALAREVLPLSAR